MRSKETNSLFLPMLMILIGMLMVAKPIYFPSSGSQSSDSQSFEAQSESSTSPDIFEDSHSAPELKSNTPHPPAASPSAPERDRKVKNEEESKTSAASEELDYQRLRRRDFLKQSVGLEDNEIAAVNQQSENILLELQSIDATSGTDIEKAQQRRKEALKRHDQWMNMYLGIEVYQQLKELNL